MAPADDWMQLGTDRYPWYPQARTFSPARLGEWDPVMADVAAIAALETHPIGVMLTDTAVSEDQIATLTRMYLRDEARVIAGLVLDDIVLDVAAATDTAVVVLAPGMGDAVQMAKAGILEIADVFVVNKADREGADRLVASIESNLALDTEFLWERTYAPVPCLVQVATADRVAGGPNPIHNSRAGNCRCHLSGNPPDAGLAGTLQRQRESRRPVLQHARLRLSGRLEQSVPARRT